MKKSSSFSLFRHNEYQLRYFVLSVSDGSFRYAQDETECKKNNKSNVQFKFTDVFQVIPDESNGGRSIDFSGEKAYPFPFTLMLSQRQMTLASKTREDREMWVRAFQVLLECRT